MHGPVHPHSQSLALGADATPEGRFFRRHCSEQRDLDENDVPPGLPNQQPLVLQLEAENENMQLGSEDVRGVMGEAPDMLDEADYRAPMSKRRTKARAFLDIPLLQDRCYILLHSFFPQRRLMEALLERTSKSCELKEMATTVATWWASQLQVGPAW